jgi:hypothetical protein
LKDAKAAAQEQLKRLLRSSPAVIYNFKPSGDFAPTFVSDNISRTFRDSSRNSTKTGLVRHATRKPLSRCST